MAAVTALVVTAGFFLGCSAPNQSAPPPELRVDPETLPEWVEGLIEDLYSKPPVNPPQYVARYWYGNQTVYFASRGYHEFAGRLFDVEGVLICNPGIGQNSDQRCADFFAARQEEEIIWRDERELTGSNAPTLLFFALAAIQVVHITLMN